MRLSGKFNLIVNITNEWQTNLSLISGECQEAGDPLGARLKLSLQRKKARKLKCCRRPMALDL